MKVCVLTTTNYYRSSSGHTTVLGVAANLRAGMEQLEKDAHTKHPHIHTTMCDWCRARWVVGPEQATKMVDHDGASVRYTAEIFDVSAAKESLIDEVRELRKDKVRLDWLTQRPELRVQLNGTSTHRALQPNGEWLYVDRSFPRSGVWVVVRNGKVIADGPTGRAVIDAAMSTEEHKHE